MIGSIMHSGLMDEDQKLRRQQVTILVVAVISIVVVAISAIRLAAGVASDATWWTLVGSSLTSIAALATWLRLRVTPRKDESG